MPLFRTRFRDASIRAKYMMSMISMLVMALICGLYVCIHGYEINHQEYIETAKSDFAECYQTLQRFETRMTHLVTLTQQNQQVNDILLSIPDFSAGEHISARRSVSQLLYTLLDGSGDYTCLMYVDPALQISDDTSRILSLADVSEESWCREALSGWGARRFYTSNEMGADSPALVAAIRDLDDYQNLIAVMRIDIDVTALERMMSTIKSEGLVTTYLETTDGVLVDSVGPETERVPADMLSDETVYGFSAAELNTLQWGKNVVYYQTLSSSGWRLMMIVHDKLLFNHIFPNFFFLALVGVLLILGGMFVAMPILWQITRRVRRFYQYVKSIRMEQLAEPLRPQANDEIGQLIEAHNGMMLRIKRLMEEQARNEQERRRLEITALQAQIKPHFLYNTLEAVSWMAKMNQPDKVESTIRSLTRFYRLCLGKGQDVISVAQELEIARNYFDVQSIRYSQDVRLEIDVDPETLQMELPKITLQPIVENALVHGLLESGRNEGTIRIFSRTSPQGEPELCVADSGSHFTDENWKRAILHNQTRSDDGYGLYNVERRLCLFFKRSSVLYLDNGDPAYSIVVLPFEKRDVEISNQ